MKNFNKGRVLLFKILQVLLLLLFFLTLIFIIKWRMDNLYLNSISKSPVEIGFIDEFINTRDEFLIRAGIIKEKKDIPLVVKDEDSLENTENILIIPEGTTIDELGDILLSKDLITSVSTYKNLVSDMGIENKITPGNYELKENMKVKEILALISNTNLQEFNFSISEGVTADDISIMLKDIGLIKSPRDFVIACNNLGANKFKPGEYKIIMPTKVNTIINTIKSN